VCGNPRRTNVVKRSSGVELAIQSQPRQQTSYSRQFVEFAAVVFG
jgi:hypothetical protein